MSLLNIDRARSLKDRINEAADPTVGALVAKYGTDVNRLKIDTAAGKVNPTNAVMAMMMIQRIVASQTQPPSGTTVAQDTGIAPPPQPMGMSAIAPQQPPTRMAYGGQVAVSNNQVPSPAMERGLDGIPIPDNMFDYAGGGMVAFAGGGDVQRFQTGNPVQAPTEVFLLQRLLQSAIANGERPEKIAEIQAALNAATSGEAKPTSRSLTPAPAAAPTATPPAAGEPVRGPGITLNSALQRLSTPMQVASPNITALQEQTKQMYPDVTIEAPDRGKIATEQLEAAKKFGYDPNLVATQKAEYATEREGLKTQRKEAADMAILKAGLNILGGTSPYAFVNIGKGGSEAAQEFGKDIREIQKLGMQLKKEQQALERAANQDALQRSDKTEAAYRDALARKEAAEQKVLDRRASTFNALLQGEYGNLREQAQQMGANLRQVASTLGSIEQVDRTTSAYGGDRRSEYARATDTNFANFKRLRDAGDPEYADKSDIELMAMASDKTQRQMRQADPRDIVAGAAASRADTERREQRSKIENRIRLMDKTYKKLKQNPETELEAERYLKQKVDEQMPEVPASAGKPAAPAASKPNPLDLNLPGRR